jgi:hypothetical protein
MSKADMVILITRNGMGEADQVLQHKLILSYLNLLIENKSLPAAICFYTEGVYLTIESSPVLAVLQSLETLGVRLILCSTCVNYYNLAEKVRVGIIGGMADILEAQLRAAKVITI